MPEYARVVRFDTTADALDELVNQINSAEGPPEGVESTRITILADRASGRAAISVRFPSEEAMKKGGAVLEKLDPPEGMTRVSVDELEVVLERTAP